VSAFGLSQSRALLFAACDKALCASSCDSGANRLAVRFVLEVATVGVACHASALLAVRLVTGVSTKSQQLVTS
jgi:hypothetical protein